MPTASINTAYRRATATAAATDPTGSPLLVGEALPSVRPTAVARANAGLRVAARTRDAAAAGTFPAPLSVGALLAAVAALGDIAGQGAAQNGELGGRSDEHGAPQPRRAAACTTGGRVAAVAPLGETVLERQVLERQVAGAGPVREDGEQPHGRALAARSMVISPLPGRTAIVMLTPGCTASADGPKVLSPTSDRRDDPAP